MIYLLIFALLLVFILLYKKWAENAGIIDRPNERSSHTRPTIRGGGIIFPAAVLIWGLFFDHSSWPFVAAVFIAGFIGFLDDRYSISQWPRLLVQSTAVVLLIWETGILSESVIWILIAFIMIAGWLNAFNFMDGINGISAFYATAVLLGVWLFSDLMPFANLSLIYVVLLCLVIFSWFNARKRALVFAGDVGSLSMGLILAYFVTMLIISTGRWEFILLLSVYGVDTVLTIVHRLLKRENIFEAHRSHLYQYLANEMKWNHLLVSFIYAVTQLLIIVGLYFIDIKFWLIYTLTVLVTLGLVYIVSKFFFSRRFDRANQSEMYNPRRKSNLPSKWI
jgi:UDP-N-acetylmuramyl pentapeptide phosphotransferase/UDP-N-acetylglucosamine-1-phosphate transferase